MGVEERIAALEQELCKFRDENRRLKEENQRLWDEQQTLLMVMEQMKVTINRLLERYVIESDK